MKSQNQNASPRPQRQQFTSAAEFGDAIYHSLGGGGTDAYNTLPERLTHQDYRQEYPGQADRGTWAHEHAIRYPTVEPRASHLGAASIPREVRTPDQHRP